MDYEEKVWAIKTILLLNLKSYLWKREEGELTIATSENSEFGISTVYVSKQVEIFPRNSMAVEIFTPRFGQVQATMERLRSNLEREFALIWLVFAKTNEVAVYTPNNPRGVFLTPSAALTAEPVISGWLMPVAKLFE
jgi:hypothetical protein